MISKKGKIIEADGKKYRVKGIVAFFVEEQENNVFDVYLNSIHLDERRNEWKSYYSVKLSNWKDFAIWQVDNYKKRFWCSFILKELKITEVSNKRIEKFKKSFGLYFCSYYNDENSFVLILIRNNVCYDIKDLTSDFCLHTLVGKEVELEVKDEDFNDIIFTLTVKIDVYIYD